MSTNTEVLRDWQGAKLCQRAVESLKRRGFKAKYFATSAEAREYILNEARAAKTIGCGGSLSMTEAGVYEAIQALGKKIMNHSTEGLSPEEKLEIRRAQLTCDLFLSGINALTADGEIVNIDGVGNRVAATIFGPKMVIMLAGRNKIVDGTLEEAVKRAKNVAAPMNAERLGCKTPCVTTGKCENCLSPENICRVTAVFSRPPKMTDIRVLIVNEDLGL